MASGQLSDLQDLVKANIGNRDDKDALITSWLNQSILEVAQRHGWPELEKSSTLTTAPNTKTTDKPTDMLRPVKLTLQDGSNSRPLVGILIEQYEEAWPRPETASTGRPNYYAYWDEDFYWYRIPDAIYTVNIKYIMVPTHFAGPTSTTELTLLDEVLVAGATYRALRSLQQYEDSRYWRTTFFELLTEAIANANQRRDTVLRMGSYQAVDPVRGDFWLFPFFGTP